MTGIEQSPNRFSQQQSAQEFANTISQVLNPNLVLAQPHHSVRYMMGVIWGLLFLQLK